MTALGNGNGKTPWLTQPIYSFSEVAHLSEVSVTTVRNWLHGYATPQGKKEPLFKEQLADEKTCSFLQLVEIIIAAKFRKAERVPFRTVRSAYENARKMHDISYPFASLELQAIGGHIVHIIRVPSASLQAMDQPESFTIPDLVQQVIKEQLDFEHELASRWYPVGKTVPIVVDPRISSGLPTVKGRGVTIGAIHRRFKANQTIHFIANDFKLRRAVVEEVIRYAEKVTI